MLEIKALTARLRKDLRVLVENLSLTLNDGDKMVIIGEEGNGKSTLIKLLFDPELVADYIEWEGEILSPGVRSGYLPQELPEKYRAVSVYEYLCGCPGFMESAPGELARLALDLGLPVEFFYSDQPMGTLSGGEKIKVQMAGICCAAPNLLLLDEPSNDIDIRTLEWLEGFINRFPHPVLYVSHDETLIENTANLILHLELVRRKTTPRFTVARLPYREYIDRRLSGLSHQAQVARKERAELGRQEEKWRRIQGQVEHNVDAYHPCSTRRMKAKMNSVKVQQKRYERQREELTDLPDVEEAILPKFDSNITLPAGKQVLDLYLPVLAVGERVLSREVRLSVRGPEHICIVGRNGAGKTTLLRKIAEELTDRKDLNAAYMPQNYEELLRLGETPVEFLAPRGDKESVTRARTFLGSMKYTPEEMAHTAAELSGGQKAKLLFLDMILRGCNLLILDEPTRNFSPLSNPVIRELLRAYPGAIISVSHDRKYMAEVCTRLYELRENGLWGPRCPAPCAGASRPGTALPGA